MRLSACITTRNRLQELEACLTALWSCNTKPDAVIVSDDSPDRAMQQMNRQLVGRYPNTTYTLGPQRGLCANRNHAVNAAPNTDLVMFLDDDVCLPPDFIAKAIARYNQMPLEERTHTFLTGGAPVRLSFLGYYKVAERSECINIHTSVFPRCFFKQEQWDETIFFGQEEGELCLRALKRGYQIVHCPELEVANTCAGNSTFHEKAIGNLTDYMIHVESSRLYVGIKRYKILEPNPLKLSLFLILYFIRMTIFLLKNRAIGAWSKIINQSHTQVMFGFVSK